MVPGRKKEGFGGGGGGGGGARTVELGAQNGGTNGASTTRGAAAMPRCLLSALGCSNSEVYCNPGFRESSRTPLISQDQSEDPPTE